MTQELQRRCTLCNKVILATSGGQLEYNWKQHQEAHARRRKA